MTTATAVETSVFAEIEELFNEAPPPCEFGKTRNTHGFKHPPCPNPAAWVMLGSCSRCRKQSRRLLCAEHHDMMLVRNFSVWCGNDRAQLSIRWLPL
jgi:hypothetical protein